MIHLLMLVMPVVALLFIATTWLWAPPLARVLARSPAALPEKGMRRILYLLPVALLIYSGLYIFGSVPPASYLANVMPSDEEMIAHFQKHRDDIERLVASYYAASTSAQWARQPEVQATMKRARIRRVNHTMGYWPPDPYSGEGARAFDKLDFGTPEGRFAARQLEALQIDIDDGRYFPQLGLWKAFLYIPGVAKTDHGRLWEPVNSNPNLQSAEAYAKTADRILPTLTGYDLQLCKEGYFAEACGGGCVYRQIEIHWFIRLCHVRP